MEFPIEITPDQRPRAWLQLERKGKFNT